MWTPEIRDTVLMAALDVVRAIEDKGRQPGWHDSVHRRHRREWPTLHRRLDVLRRAVKQATAPDLPEPPR